MFVKRFLCLTVMGLVSSLGVVAQSDLPAPRDPKFPEQWTVEDLLPNARIVLKRERYLADGIIGAGLKKGDKFLIMANSSWDPLVIEALQRVIQEEGATVDILVSGGLALEHPPGGTSDPGERMRFREGATTMASWRRDAMLQYDKVIGYLAHGSKWGWLGETQTVRWEYPLREQLYSKAPIYPDELLYAITQKVWRKFINSKTIRITEPLGTDLTLTLGEEYWKEYAKYWGMALWQEDNLEHPIPHEVHISLVPSLAPRPDANGVVVTRALHSGPIPELKIYFEGGQVVRIEDGGKAGEYMKEAIERFKNVQWPAYPGPGIGWLEEISLGTNPKAIRPFSYEEYTKMGRFPQWSFGRRRSGIVHLAFGTRHNREFIQDEQSGLPYNHRDVEIYFPTYYVDGEKIVENGRLLVLDDPEIRRLAAQYGDPDELLSEDWIPGFGQ